MNFWQSVRWKIFKLSYFDKSGEPIKCFDCGCTDFKSVTKGTDGGYVSEFSVECTRCKQQANYWAFGYYDTSIFEPEPWIKIFMKLWK